MASIVVVGGGVGGLSAAIRLRAAGHDVALVERNKVGGKLATSEWNGFRFDTGPSLLTMPDVFDDLFAIAGAQMDDYLELVPLHEPFEYRFWEGDQLRTSMDVETTRERFEEFSPGAGGQWDRFIGRAERTWRTAERTFFAGPMESWKNLVARMRSPLDLLHIDPFMTLSGRAEQAFNDARLRAWVNRYATYSGSDPFRAPATLACIAYLEQVFGCWHVVGGLGSLATALKRLCEEIDVKIFEGVTVEGIDVRKGAVAGLRTSAGTVPARIVVSDIDAAVLYNRILPNEERSKRLDRTQPSSSVLAMSLALRDKTPDAAHHTVWFPRDQAREFDAIFRGKGWTDDCTIYACNPVVSDASMAPPGSEAWTLLLNVGSGAQADWEGLAARVLDRIGVTGRVRHAELTTPQDLEERFANPGGSIYGTSSNGWNSAFLRPSNRGPVDGLYLTGGSAHPGGGLPLVAMSGEIVARMIEMDLRR